MCNILLATHNKDCKVYKHVRIAPHRCNWTIIKKRTRKQKNDKRQTSTKENVPPKCKKEKEISPLLFLYILSFLFLKINSPKNPTCPTSTPSEKRCTVKKKK